MSGITIGSEILKKESQKSRVKRLIDFTFGIGLEHEVQLFHKPPHIGNNIDSFVMLDSKKYIEELLKAKKLSLLDEEFIAKIPFEVSGRKCQGLVVLKATPFPMPELVTENPMSSLRSGKRPIESYCQEMRAKEDRYLRLLHMNEKIAQLEDRYGQLSQYPFGMTNYLKYDTEKTKSKNKTKYQFAKNSRGEDILHTDYLGSYHITLTLPFSEKTPLKKFIAMHQNYANQIQWLEPLLIAVFFSSDQKAVGTTEQRIKGSFRVARIGWGNFAGSDVRKFGKGIGRYSNIKSYWREGLEFKDVKRTQYCEKLAPNLRKIEPGAISGYSSNFRTFGSTDPLRPWHRESGIGMTKPNGVELRIFDHFDSGYINELCILVIYIAENSRVHKSTEYVYKNADWITLMHRIMLEGWCAQVPAGYVADLRRQLGLRIRTKTLMAYDLIVVIARELYEKNRDGDWTFLMLERKYDKPIKLPEINRRSWETGLMVKLNREAKLMSAFNGFCGAFPKTTKRLTLDEFATAFYRWFSREEWKADIINIVYFMESIGLAKITKNIYGEIAKIEILVDAIRKRGTIKNFNLEIVGEWDRPFLEEYIKYLNKTQKMK